VKQSVSAPAAAVVLLMGVLGFFVVFNRAKLAPEPEAPTVLPWSPPLEPRELNQVRQGLLPLGVRVVMPPLASDRFKGVRVALIAAASPAAEGGLQAGDLIVSFDGRHMSHPYALTGLLGRASPDRTYEVVIVRAGEEKTLQITGVTPLPPEEQIK
jgi:S1-C subfamily serine protease